MYSAAATGILDSRSSSRTASFLTASGMPAASILARSSSISLACSSPSPSSFWIAFICSRRKYSRWFLPTSDCTCDWMRDPSSSTSSSLIRIRLSASIRARTSSVDRISCFTGVPMVARLDAMKSASLPGSVMLAASVWRSSDSSGDSETTCWKLLLMLRCSASISRWSSSRSWSGATVTRGAQERARLDDAVERDALDALHDQPQAAVRQLEHLVDVRDGADRIQVFLHRLFDRRLRAA